MARIVMLGGSDPRVQDLQWTHTELLKTDMLSITEYICRSFLASMDSMLANIRAYATGGVFLSDLNRSLLSMVSRLLIRKM